MREKMKFPKDLNKGHKQVENAKNNSPIFTFNTPDSNPRFSTRISGLKQNSNLNESK